MVGASGFAPPTSWIPTRESACAVRLARTEFETFRCTVFLGLFKRAAFGIAPNAHQTMNGQPNRHSVLHIPTYFHDCCYCII